MLKLKRTIDILIARAKRQTDLNTLRASQARDAAKRLSGVGNRYVIGEKVYTSAELFAI